jgi:hypothetical protein
VQPGDVKDYRDLDAVAADAAGTLDRAAQPSLFDRLDWQRLTLAHCPPPGRLHVLRAGEAWLFLMIDGRTARVLASWYSLRAGVIGDTAQIAAIAARLRMAKLARVILGPMTADRAIATVDGFARAGWRARRTITTHNWTIATGGISWDDYWAARPAALRHTVERKARARRYDVTIVDRFDAAMWGDYEAVYRQSWKPAEGSFAFLRALAEQEGAAGTLRLGVARHGTRPVAAQYWLVESGRATIHKLAHIESERAYSPGTLLSHAMFRAVIERDRPALIDFGTGDETHKADWMDHRAPLYMVDLAHPATMPGLAHALRLAASTLVRRAASD